MKKITLSYCVYEERTFEVPTSGKWHKFFTAWEKDEDELTDSEWKILNRYSLKDFICSQTDKDIGDDIDVVDYD